MHRFTLSCLLGFVLCSPTAPAQNQSSLASDSQATALATAAMLAMSGRLPIRDVRMTAQVIHIAGSDYDTGTADLAALGTGQSRIDLDMGDRRRSEIRTDATELPEGFWSDRKGTHRTANHNCWTDAVWFAPALSSLLSAANTSEVIFSYVGQESRAGILASHLRAYRKSRLVDSAFVRRLSTTDFYLDSASHLPLAIVFNVHPDNDDNIDIHTEIRFADYRVVDGVRVPFHIQRLLNGGLFLDLVVTNVTINSGVPESLFSIR